MSTELASNLAKEPSCRLEGSFALLATRRSKFRAVAGHHSSGMTLEDAPLETIFPRI
jgi:hypothetical protein